MYDVQRTGLGERDDAERTDHAGIGSREERHHGLESLTVGKTVWAELDIPRSLDARL
jgi:hypothetical protein